MLNLCIVTNLLCFFFLNHAIAVAETTEKANAGNENINSAQFVTKDELNDILELMKLQGRRISNLENEMKEKDKALSLYGEKIRALENTVVKQTQKVSEQEFDMKENAAKVKELDAKLVSFEKNYDKKCFKVDSGATNDSSGNDSFATLKQEGAPTKQRFNRMVKTKQNGRNIIKDISYKRSFIANTHVSFSTYLSHLQEHLGTRQVVKFDRVITNDRNAYNPHTGIFTVPITGTYVFIFYVSSSNARVEFNLMADDSLKASGVARPDDFSKGNDVQGGGTVILHLNQGVSVWIQNTYAESIVWSSSAHRWVTFSGFLLY